MIRKLKKGFTLVELVVVIAVIAILAAVSVVSYVSITKKAKESHDQQIIDQINLTLSAEEAAGRKPETMHKALEVLEANGFAPERFNSNLYSGYDLAYLLRENKFVLLTENTSTVVYPEGVSASTTHELWKFATAEDSLADGFSHYLSGDDQTGDRLVSTGLDVGNNTGISAVTYTGADPAKDIVIRTNSTADAVNLKVTAYENGLTGDDYACDHITHYGLAGYVQVIKGGKKSVTTGGTIGYAEITDGKFYPINNGDVEVVVAVGENAVIAPAQGTGKYGKTLAASKSIKDGHTGDGKVALSYPEGINDDSTAEEIAAALAGEKSAAISDVTPLPDDPYAALIAEIESNPSAQSSVWACINGGEYTFINSLPSDPDSGNKTYVLLANATEIQYIEWLGANITIDLNGKQASVAGDGIWLSGCTLTLKDSKGGATLSLKAINNLDNFWTNQGSSLYIESGNYNFSGVGIDGTGAPNSRVYITGGTFNKFNANANPAWYDTTLYDLHVPDEVSDRYYLIPKA